MPVAVVPNTAGAWRFNETFDLDDTQVRSIYLFAFSSFLLLFTYNCFFFQVFRRLIRCQTE